MNLKAAELRVLTDSELREQLEATHRSLFTCRFRLSTRQMANSAELTRVRRQIARINTILREREVESSASPVEDQGQSYA